MTIQALKRRFDDLLVQLDEVDRSQNSDHQVEGDLFLGWRVKARNLLLHACGADSEHYKEFQNWEKDPGFGGWLSHRPRSV